MYKRQKQEYIKKGFKHFYLGDDSAWISFWWLVCIFYHSGAFRRTLIGYHKHSSQQDVYKRQVIDELKLQSSFAERVQFVENWLLSNMKIFSSDFKLNTVIKAIYYINNNRNYKLNTVSKEVGVSNPTLNRYFKEVLGISPKQCFKALRFKTALKNYRANGSYDLYDELGYTDFSHFVKEAKNLANTTPSEL